MNDHTPAPGQPQYARTPPWRPSRYRTRRRHELELLRDRVQLLEAKQAAYAAALSGAFQIAGLPVPADLQRRRSHLTLVAPAKSAG